MHLGRLATTSLVIGFDIRVAPVFSDESDSKLAISLDPSVWASRRDAAPGEALSIYEISRISDKSNGLNLFVTPPTLPVPTGYVLAAFDALQDTVEYMCESFGLQPSLEFASDELKDWGFSFLGYDVVDLWTQSSALVGVGDLIVDNAVRNAHGLIERKDEGITAAKFADGIDPERAPFQVVGVWIKQEPA